jgi:hypothetical protein
MNKFFLGGEAHLPLKRKMRKTPKRLGVFLIGLPTEVIISKEGNISLCLHFTI